MNAWEKGVSFSHDKCKTLKLDTKQNTEKTSLKDQSQVLKILSTHQLAIAKALFQNSNLEFTYFYYLIWTEMSTFSTCFEIMKILAPKHFLYGNLKKIHHKSSGSGLIKTLSNQ